MIERHSVAFRQWEVQDVLRAGLEPDWGREDRGADGVTGTPLVLSPARPPARVPLAVSLGHRVLLDDQNLVVAQVLQQWVLWATGGKQQRKKWRV